MKFKYILVFCIGLLFTTNVNAYVRVDSNGGFFDPVNKNITDVNSDWGSNGSTFNFESPWLYSIGQYFYAGSLSGSYLYVNADYYLGIKTFNDSDVSSYLTSARNTLTSSNLRCGIGDYKNGYNNSYLPEITNFNVSLDRNTTLLTGNYQYLFHITFNYKQHIPKVTLNNVNLSCWFERSPSDGLFAQVQFNGYTYTTARYYYYNKSIQFAVTDDSNTVLLQDSINEQKKTNQKLDNLNDSINNSDTSEATSGAGNFFSGFETDTFGLTSIITSPLTLIGSITNSSCSELGLPLPFVNKTLYLPCLSSIYSQYFGDLLTIYQIITFGIVAYWVCVRIFALVKDFKNPDHDEIEVMDL